jgi:hypothetical protein
MLPPKNEKLTNATVMTCIKLCFAAPLCGLWALMLVTTSMGCRVVNVIPPKNSTEGSLTATRNRIEQYWAKHQRVPNSPDELPVQKNRDCSMTDGWGRKLGWESDGKCKVRVWSFGRDGIAGGNGEDADMETVFDGSVKQESP